MSWRRVALVLGLAATLGSCAVAYARPLTGAATSADASFDDAPGDSGAAPDLRAVYAYPSATSITFGFGWSAVPTKGVVAVWIDSDANPSTGDARSHGFDYRIAMDLGRTAYGFEHWTGTAWGPAAGGFARRSGGYIYLGVDKLDLVDGGNDIHFGVSTSASTDGSSVGDLAPDTGWWSESFAPTQLTVETSKVGSVRAGGTLTVSAQVRRSDTRTLVSSSDGNVSCSATVGGRELTLRKSAIVAGDHESTARCVWATTKRMKGRTVSGQIAVLVKEAFVIKKFRVGVR